MFDFMTPEFYHNVAIGLFFGTIYVFAIAAVFWTGEQFVSKLSDAARQRRPCSNRSRSRRSTSSLTRRSSS